jgi:hypothetical protein
MPASIDFIVPSYKSNILTPCAIRTFEKYKGDYDFRYIIVENAADESYRQDVLKISQNVLWINNRSKNTIANNKHAWGNAEALDIGLKNATSEYVFICHNDVAATNPNWMDSLYEKTKEGYEMVGTRFDNPQNERIGAIHISGMLLNRELALRTPSIFPEWNEETDSWKLDVGDSFTRFFRENNLKYFCFRNTHNKNVDVEIPSPFDGVTFDRVFNDDDEVIYMHLGRGSLKENAYRASSSRNNIVDWEEFINKEILGDLSGS